MNDLNESEQPPPLDVSPLLEPRPDGAFSPSATSLDASNPPVLPESPVPAPRELPTLGNTLLFFLLAVAVTLTVGILIVAIATLLAHHPTDFRSLALDPRLAIPSQALEYLALLGAAALLFRAIWQQPFWETLHWNASAVSRRWIPLLVAGVALGLLNGAASNLLPMPKEAPILNDLMRSTTGAWLMFIFGTTLAPLMEEIAFRGFLLPSLIHFFNRRSRRAQQTETIFTPAPSPPRQGSAFILPASILLASLPFALLHSEQVAGAWAPVLLIGVVSVVLCIVRLWARSLAASAFVHATYNFTLFAGMAIASDGFRHLDKLNN